MLNCLRLLIKKLIQVICSLIIISNKIKERSLFSNHFWDFFKTVMRSPYNLCMMAISLICIRRLLIYFKFQFYLLVRILWINIDPFLFLGIWNRSIERLLYEIVYSLLFSIYSIILWVWYYIFEKFMSNKLY